MRGVERSSDGRGDGKRFGGFYIYIYDKSDWIKYLKGFSVEDGVWK